MDQFVRGPDANFDLVPGFVRDEMELNILSGFNLRDLEGLACKRDAAIAISHAVMLDAKDVLG